MQGNTINKIAFEFICHFFNKDDLRHENFGLGKMVKRFINGVFWGYEDDYNAKENEKGTRKGQDDGFSVDELNDFDCFDDED